jgi:predicted nucleic acid-binding protein
MLMATIFLDSSALVRRYAQSEPGAATVRAICAPRRGHTVLIARIAPVEVASAFSRKVREGAQSTSERARLWRLFQQHQYQQYQSIPLSDDVFADAWRLVFTHPLRAYDAIHLACALDVASRLPLVNVEFWTADRRQAQVASAEGLAVQVVG